MPDANLLYYGDTLDVLRRHVRDESVDLVYLDPPFTGLSARQLRSWDGTGLFSPTLIDDYRRRA